MPYNIYNKTVKVGKMNEENMIMALKIKKLNVFTALYKLLIYLYIGVERQKELRYLLGSGSYYNAVMKAARQGYVVVREDGSVVLTEKGRRIADILYTAATQLLRETEKER